VEAIGNLVQPMLVIGNRAVNKEHFALSRHRDDSVPVFVQLNRVIWSVPVYIDSTDEKTRRYTVASRLLKK